MYLPLLVVKILKEKCMKDIHFLQSDSARMQVNSVARQMCEVPLYTCTTYVVESYL